MGVHARSWHLNWSSPVEIVMRQSESKLLDLNFSQGGLVQRYKEVSGTHASLGSLHWNEEEVKFFALGASYALNKITVNDATTGRVVETALTIDDKE